MKKALLIFISLIIVAIIAVVVYLLTHFDSLLKEAIETFGSQATHTRVQVKKVHFSFENASVSIKGLTVANPPGFSTPNAFSLGQISTQVDIKKTDKKKITINEILIKAPEIFYEVNAEKKANLNMLKDRLGGSGKKPTPPTESKNKAAMPILTIHKIDFSGAALHALLVPLKNKQYDLKLPAFTLTNLHGTPDQISRQVLNRIIDRARDEIRRKGIDAEINKARAKLKSKVDAEKAKAKGKLDSQVQEQKDKAQDKLKSLFGK